MERYFCSCLLGIFLMLGLMQNTFAASVASSFRLPLENYPESDGCLEWGGTNDEFPGKRHLADDACVPEGTHVFAVANGVVKYAASYTPCPDWGYLIIIEHTMSDGSKVTSIYGHTIPDGISIGDEVTEGQYIGTIMHHCRADHIHFGIYEGPYTDIACYGPGNCLTAGYMVNASWPGKYTDPVKFIKDNELDCSPYDSYFTSREQDLGDFIGNSTADSHQYDSSDVCSVDFDNTGTSYGTSALLYDSSGGARKAYLVRSGFWSYYDQNCGGPNGDCPEVPVADCGAPIDDEYANGPGQARQDFQKCYFFYDGSSESAHPYPVVGPGWTTSGWNSTASYAFAEAYERNGARNTMGEPADVFDGAEVHHWGEDSSQPFIQDFEGGSWGWAAIMFNDTDSNAYVIRTGFWGKYQELGPSAAGEPCEDEHDSEQEFEKLTMTWNGRTVSYVSKSSSAIGCSSTRSAQSQTCNNGSVYTHDSTVYWCDEGTLRGVTSPEVFDSCQFNWDELTPMSDSLYELLPEGDVVDDSRDCGAVSAGSLVNVDNTVYWYDGRSLRGVVSSDVFNACGFDWGEIQDESADVLDPLGWGDVVDDPVDCGALKDGDLFTTDGTTTVYQYKSGLKRGITSSTVFDACDFDWGSIHTFPASSVTDIADGSVINSSSVCYLTPDLVWREYSSGDLAAWFMSDTTISSGASISSSSTAWSVVGSGDFNLDGSVDILWRHNSSPYELYLWEMSGSTVTSSVQIVPSSDSGWVIRGVSDFTSDGEPDILWKNQSTGELGVWVMEGTVISSSEQVASSSDTSWDIRATGDLTGDGNPDILWRNPSNGALSLWQMDGTSYVSSIPLATSSLTSWDVEAIGDFTTDGVNDLLWRNLTSGEMGLWKMSGTSYVSSIGMTTSSSAWDMVTAGGMSN